MRIAVTRGLVALTAALSLTGCTKAQLASQSPSYVVLDALSASSGATPSEFAGTLASDVVTMVKQTVNGQDVVVATVYEDDARVTAHLAMTDPGTAEKPTTPSPANTVTFTRYHVNFTRADGRNTPGVDVPYAFDGGMTMSVVGGNVSIGQLTLVRSQAKEEAPLKALRGGGGAITISTIAEVTFYGTDQAGRSVSVMGRINVNFADWGDPKS